MTKSKIFIAMFRALDCLYDENPHEELAEYLSEANPYLFKDRKPADSGIEEEFNEFVDKDMESPEAYACVKKYLAEKTDFAKLFSDISLEEWNDLCNIIEEEPLP